MKLKVIKKKNFEGYYYRCAKCGEELKHPYMITGKAETYGKDCVWQVYNEIKDAMWNKIGQ